MTVTLLVFGYLAIAAIVAFILGRYTDIDPGNALAWPIALMLSATLGPFLLIGMGADYIGKLGAKSAGRKPTKRVTPVGRF